MNLTTLWLQGAMVLATMALFTVGLVINELILSHFEFTRGINWIYLPAGVRLLATLLFAEAGAFGLLLISWLVCFFYFFPDDLARSLAGGVLASLAPYLVYRIAKQKFGLCASLANLSPRRLLFLIVAYALASPLLHHVWFALQGERDILRGFFAMFVGDLTGTLLVVYGVKAGLNLLNTSHRSMR
jgi:hypothetical protein